jgi:hypothetical protein
MGFTVYGLACGDAEYPSSVSRMDRDDPEIEPLLRAKFAHAIRE